MKKFAVSVLTILAAESLSRQIITIPPQEHLYGATPTHGSSSQPDKLQPPYRLQAILS